MTPPPFTWSAKSDDERLVTRLPAGILESCGGVTQPIRACAQMEPQTNPNPDSLLCVSVHVHFPLCVYAIMLYITPG